MRFTELTVLLPCHSLEDFPVYHEGAAADELLGAWCAPWHPALLASAGAVPNWQRIDVPPETLAGRLIVTPPFCLDRLPAGFVARAKSEGACLVQEPDRDRAVAAALAALDGGDAGVEEALAADFLALGFCRLQIELLTRHMRFSTNIDETHFEREAVAAAQAAVGHDGVAAREHLLQCFDTLYEARKHFYPVDVYLVDVTLLAATTLGENLQRELAGGTPTNLLGPMSLLSALANQHPESWSSLTAAIDAATACVLGDEPEESELPLLPLETALASLDAGVRQYTALLGRGPRVYARRRAGLGPALPQLLTKLAFQGALHFTLDDGRFPLAPQSKTRWEGLDSSVLDVLARVPCDAARPESFLGLSRRMADAMDTDHVATVIFAHWPHGGSPWHDVLRRVARLSPVLGKFMLLDDYFSHTDMPGRLSKFEPDDYRTPYLQQAIVRGQPDPISRYVVAHRSQAERAAVQAILTLDDLIVGKTAGVEASCADGDAADAGEESRTGSETAQRRGQPHFAAGTSQNWDSPRSFETGSKTPLTAALGRLAAWLPRTAAPPSPRYLVVNTLSVSRSIGLEVPRLEHPPEIRTPVVAAGLAAERKFAVVDVPPLGFAWIEPGGSPPAASRVKPLAQDNVLRNEFFEATISRTTGGIQSLYSFNQRGNQLSQQIAFRMPQADAEACYSSMRADAVEVSAACAACGEIVSRGALVDGQGRRLAGFRQIVQVWSGSRLLRIEIELDGLEEPRADPWNAYYAARFAWPEETAGLYRGVALARQKTTATRLEAPEYVTIDNGSGTTSILTGGLPYHRLSEPRMLDTLLVVRGETARRFSLAVGVDLPNPAAAAVEFITPCAALFDDGSPPATSSGWFFHLSAKNVVATHWQPLVDTGAPESATDGAQRAITGFRARLLETAGRAGRVTLRAFRQVAHARQVDFLGETLLEVPVEDDKIMLDFAAHEWIEVEARWSR
jgi:alpha-mannosidase